MSYEPALLEEWMRKYYINAKVDIGSSGVHPWSFGEIREKLNISNYDLDKLSLMDSTSYGQEALRVEIANRWGNGDLNSVMVTHGSSEGIYLALNSLLTAGDHVVVLEPCYHSLENIAEEIGCNLSRWYLREEDGFKPDIQELRKLITEGTKMVILNFPHNPTGTTLKKQEMLEIIELVSKFDSYLLWDGAFSDLVYEGNPLPDPTKYYKKAISTGTFSKSYGLPGMRFGWCLAAPEVLEEFIPLRDRITLHLSPLIEYLALKIIRDIDILANDRYNLAKQNLLYLSKWMEKNQEYIDWIRPGGGVTVFPKIKLDIDVDKMCEDLGNQSNVLLVPGSCFGHRKRVRLGFGCTAEELNKGLEYLEQYISK